MTRLTAYVAYAVGSAVFLAVAVARDSTAVVLGSALFLAGTLLLAVPEARRVRAHRRGRASAPHR